MLKFVEFCCLIVFWKDNFLFRKNIPEILRQLELKRKYTSLNCCLSTCTRGIQEVRTISMISNWQFHVESEILLDVLHFGWFWQAGFTGCLLKRQDVSLTGCFLLVWGADKENSTHTTTLCRGTGIDWLIGGKYWTGSHEEVRWHQWSFTFDFAESNSPEWMDRHIQNLNWMKNFTLNAWFLAKDCQIYKSKQLNAAKSARWQMTWAWIAHRQQDVKLAFNCLYFFCWQVLIVTRLMKITTAGRS